MSQLWIIYDSRAEDGNTDDASVYCTADSLSEAFKDVREMFPDGVIYRYDISTERQASLKRILKMKAKTLLTAPGNSLKIRCFSLKGLA